MIPTAQEFLKLYCGNVLDLHPMDIHELKNKDPHYKYECFNGEKWADLTGRIPIGITTVVKGDTPEKSLTILREEMDCIVKNHDIISIGARCLMVQKGDDNNYYAILDYSIIKRSPYIFRIKDTND